MTKNLRVKTGKAIDDSILGDLERQTFSKYLNSVEKNVPIDISQGESKRLLNLNRWWAKRLG